MQHKFLLKHIRRRSDGLVSLPLIAKLRPVKKLYKDFPVIVNSLRNSKKLEMNANGSKIRRIEPLSQLLLGIPIVDKKTEASRYSKNQENFNMGYQQRNTTA